ncbi:MAG TPA: hypothetical protein VJ842_10980 [Pyrinomonadaceae bacterium]|nr:hypothetical protein [Pyrinomonadaceae bacterium]
MQNLRTRIKFGARFFASVGMLFISMVIGGAAHAQTTIVNYDFNAAAAYPVAPTTTAPGVTSSATSTEAFVTFGGTATTAGAFTQNPTAGNALAMNNSSGTNTRYFQFQLGGASLVNYASYKIYFQAQRSGTGATTITLAYSTDGTTFTNFPTTGAPGNGSFNAILFDLSTVTALNNRSSITFRLLASGASGTGTLRIDNFQVQAVNSPVPLIISEFRTFGPTGTCDEFVEIYNRRDTAYTVQAADNSLGFAVAQSNGNVLFIIENGKVIPARGHYLSVNNGGGGCTGSYSGGDYPAGSPAATATGDDTMNEDIPSNAGIALFNTSNQGSFNTDNRLDAVGTSAEANPLYVEGTGYPPINPAAPNIGNHSLYRDMRTTGVPKDTNNNETDFFVVDTNGATICTETVNFKCQRLGAPGPENTSSPVQRNDLIKSQLVDLQCTSIIVNPTLPSACRFERNTTAGGSPATRGTISIRRRFTNSTQQTITRLRFRIVDITTLPEGGVNGMADLRAITSPTVMVFCQSEAGITHTCTDTGGPITTIEGTTLEQQAAPNDQPNGGAFNSTLTLAVSLVPNASINVQFRLGVESNGFFRFFVNVEALPSPAGIADPGVANTKARATGKAARAAKDDN